MTSFIQKPDTEIQLKALTKRIGAEISNIHLSADLDDEVIEFIHQALLKHKVLFFRNQQHLDNVAHEKFAERFGQPIKHPTVPAAEGSNYIFELDSSRGGRANSWHTCKLLDKSATDSCSWSTTYSSS